MSAVAGAAAGAPLTHLLYLHGFRSSPQSTKARRLAAWLSAHRAEIVWACPQLPPSPRQALDEIEAAIAGWPRDRMAAIGSSLGGFYATIVAKRTGCRAVVMNPAVEPARDLAAFIGEQKAWHGDERFFFRPEYIDELRAIAPPAALRHPERCLAVIAKGDELLSWREMQARYAACRMLLLEGGDHALSDFERPLAELLAFLGLMSEAPQRAQ